MVTDGADNASKTSPHEATEAFTGQNVRLFVFLIRTAAPAGRPVLEVVPKEHNTLVNSTGGSMPRFFLDTSRRTTT